MNFSIADAAPVAAKIGLVLLLAMFGTIGQSVAFALLILWSLRGARYTIEALTLAALLSGLNSGIFPEAQPHEALRFAILPVAMISNAIRIRLRRESFTLPLIALVLFAVAVVFISLNASYFPSGSIVRVILFLSGALAILVAAVNLGDEVVEARKWLLYSFGIIVILGFPLIVTGLGYTVNGRGFQGLLGQPQAYGVVLAAYGSWIALQAYTGELRGAIWRALVLVTLISLVATEARTGLLAFMLGVAAGFLVYATNNKEAGYKTVLSLSLLMIGCAAFWALSGGLMDAIWDIVRKQSQGLNLVDLYLDSRGRLSAASWQNFQQHPWTGIGFSLPSRRLDMDVTWVGPLPVVASSEKGNLFVAVLEEVGILGTGFFALLFLSLLRAPILARNASGTALALAALATNVGESTFFFMGGVGLTVWLFVAFTLAEALYRPSSNLYRSTARTEVFSGRPATESFGPWLP
jgi:hypothetical protein